MKKSAATLAVLAVSLILSAGTRAQTAQQQGTNSGTMSNQDLELLRKDIRSQKKQLIAANLNLSDTEATKFWPVYDQYSDQQTRINDQRVALLQEYAANWKTISNDQALSLARRWADTDTATTQLRQKYVPIVAQVLTGKNTATFFQLDRRISMMIELQMASEIPLVQSPQ
jgi:hypothetical protein